MVVYEFYNGVWLSEKMLTPIKKFRESWTCVRIFRKFRVHGCWSEIHMGYVWSMVALQRRMESGWTSG